MDFLSLLPTDVASTAAAKRKPQAAGTWRRLPRQLANLLKVRHAVERVATEQHDAPGVQGHSRRGEAAT